LTGRLQRIGKSLTWGVYGCKTRYEDRPTTGLPSGVESNSKRPYPAAIAPGS
jgi:hypothetical protein